jgi:hypothetical protein
MNRLSWRHTRRPTPTAKSQNALRSLHSRVLVGAISMARAVDDPDLSEQILTNAAIALKQCIPKVGGSNPPPTTK